MQISSARLRCQILIITMTGIAGMMPVPKICVLLYDFQKLLWLSCPCAWVWLKDCRDNMCSWSRQGAFLSCSFYLSMRHKYRILRWWNQMLESLNSMVIACRKTPKKTYWLMTMTWTQTKIAGKKNAWVNKASHIYNYQCLILLPHQYTTSLVFCYIAVSTSHLMVWNKMTTTNP
jgi:hypothetical protein